ncbi:MAG TPA: gliding motility-associated ABC transporter permease subunit GldF [Bacteroidales bacterium]|jgi:ABC-2 type transport system permease protein|nr:gliding motility-associated ABC transporter permease subunit GldF [Bacteroidales bacterium]
MGTLLRKEIASFFHSFTGYLVIAVFLLITGLFLFVFQGEMNILRSGYASVDGLFILAPWIFLFLAPAISMRFFSDEKKSGTIELLLTYPISDISIVLAKFTAGIILLTISLLPTLLYVFTVYALGSPPGNLDGGATIGAYIGLLLIGGMYVAIGTLVSSFTDNQIISFIISAVICFVFFTGFDSLAEIIPSTINKNIITSIGIQQHYNSISRGVIDTRDLIYFVSCIIFFLYLTTLNIRKKRR